MSSSKNAAQLSRGEKEPKAAAKKQIQRQTAELKSGQGKEGLKVSSGTPQDGSKQSAHLTEKFHEPDFQCRNVQGIIDSGARTKEKSGLFSDGLETLTEKERGQRLVELAARLLEDDAFIAAYVVGNKKAEDAVIENYLKTKLKTAPVMGRGSAALAPAAKPKTLEEAGRLCKLYLNGL